jgi:DNA-binding NarL/FixJ family response regulator
MANIILIDDHEIVTDSLKYLIEDQSPHKVIAKFNNAEDALAHIKQDKTHIDVVVSDIKLPNMSGLELTKEIKNHNKGIKIILLSQFASREFVVNGLRNGASGYLLKSADGGELVKAINNVLEGTQHLCANSTQVLISATSENYEALTEREMEVLKYTALGLSAKEIADKMCVQANTIDYHKKNIKEKFNVSKQTDLTRIAIEMGLIN